MKKHSHQAWAKAPVVFTIPQDRFTTGWSLTTGALLLSSCSAPPLARVVHGAPRNISRNISYEMFFRNVLTEVVRGNVVIVSPNCLPQLSPQIREFLSGNIIDWFKGSLEVVSSRAAEQQRRPGVRNLGLGGKPTSIVLQRLLLHEVERQLLHRRHRLRRAVRAARRSTSCAKRTRSCRIC